MLDYKIFCFNGEPRFFKIDFNRSTNHQANYYDLKGTRLSLGEKICPPSEEVDFPLPMNFEEMVSIAHTLAIGFPFVRVDLYNVNGKIYFGEMTFYPASGFGKFTDDKWDFLLGEYLDLPSNQK